MVYFRRIETILLVSITLMIVVGLLYRIQPQTSASNPETSLEVHPISDMTNRIMDTSAVTPATIPSDLNHSTDLMVDSSVNISPMVIMPEKMTYSKPANRPTKKNGSKSKLEFRIHTVTKRSTLKKLARQFYGSPLYYPLLLENNPHIDNFEILENTSVSILKSRRQMIHIYNHHRIKEKGRLIWRYMTTEQDTIESICKKFYHTNQSSIPVINLNPENRLKPGELVKIRLDEHK